ncbi:pyridoxamine 5'-phosphate oxidase family protein [Pseudomonadota bacterium]
MGKQYDQLSDKHIAFIQQQKMYFVATAPNEGKINLSPKGMDSFRVLDNNRVVWLNLTGSGNETAAHLLENTRMTIMFCAFEGDPKILRLYGHAAVLHPRDDGWEALYSNFEPQPGARQLFDMQIDTVQTSCGKSVPFYEYTAQREELSQWAERKGEEGVKQYWQDRNQVSLDGKPTRIIE